MPEGNPFSDLIPGYQPPAQTQAPPPLRQIVPPRPKQPTPQTPAQAKADELDVELKRMELEERRQKVQRTQKDLREIGFELRNVMDKAFRARELSKQSMFATGGGAPIARVVGSLIGGTDANAIKGALDVIGGNVAFDRLQKMREESPTGGALGAVTERELDLLKSTIASLDPDQPDEDFQGAMQNIANAYGRVLMKLPGGRAMMIERGWLPKSGGGGKKPPAQKQASPKVIDFNDLPE